MLQNPTKLKKTSNVFEKISWNLEKFSNFLENNVEKSFELCVTQLQEETFRLAKHLDLEKFRINLT